MEDNKIKFSSFQAALGRESVESWGWGHVSQYYSIWLTLLGKFIIKLIKHC